MPGDRKTAIRVEGVSKAFKIPHEKHATLKSFALNIFSRKDYTKLSALDEVGFEVKKGEFFGIIGRNGSGKSTLLKILAGIYIPDRGKVEINGKISPFLELGVGFNPDLTGRENIFLGGSILGLTRREIEEKFDHIADFADLQEFMDLKLKNYSSGMQVRLAFSLAINAYAEILLMDEVLAVGDANFQAKCIDEFIRYKKEGKTVVLVTHDLASVLKYCDRVLFLNEGRIQGIGDADKMIYEYELVSARYTDDRARGSGDDGPGRWGTGDVIISETEILGPGGEPGGIIKSYEDMIFRVHYVNQKGVDRAIFGIDIANMEGHRLFGFHTGMVNQEITLKEKGYVDFIAEAVPLRDGRYYLSPAVANDRASIQYDYRKDFRTFSVVNPGVEKSFYGDVNLRIRIDERSA